MIETDIPATEGIAVEESDERHASEKNSEGHLDQSHGLRSRLPCSFPVVGALGVSAIPLKEDAQQDRDTVDRSRYRSREENEK
jgi:hypothetical protein